jgi:hypothetical protein
MPFKLAGGDTILDLGSGPLTLPLALWTALPELRPLALEFKCIDRTGTVLEAGKKLFEAYCGTGGAWNIKTIRGPLETELYGKKAQLSAALNVFNENERYCGDRATASAALLLSRSAEDAYILALEPGVPRSGAFIAGLRGALQRGGKPPALPCTHCGDCPLESGRTGPDRKWCHFAFGTEDAPAALHRLSQAAGLPKERAVLSFVLAAPESAAVHPAGMVRIISDPFPVAGRWGRYGCSGQGLVLVRGDKEKILRAESGAALLFPETTGKNVPRDGKTGFPCLEIQDNL